MHHCTELQGGLPLHVYLFAKTGALSGTRTRSVTDLNRVCLPISPPGRYKFLHLILISSASSLMPVKKSKRGPIIFLDIVYSDF